MWLRSFCRSVKLRPLALARLRGRCGRPGRSLEGMLCGMVVLSILVEALKLVVRKSLVYILHQ